MKDLFSSFLISDFKWAFDCLCEYFLWNGSLHTNLIFW